MDETWTDDLVQSLVEHNLYTISANTGLAWPNYRYCQQTAPVMEKRTSGINAGLWVQVDNAEAEEDELAACGHALPGEGSAKVWG